MPDWLLWAAAIVLAVAAGWAWNEWRHRAAGRRSAGPGDTRPEAGGGTRDRRGGTRGGGSRGGVGGTRPGGRGDTRTRSRRGSRDRVPAPPRPRTGEATPARTPRPGEIWWADVPYADGSGSKVRPCLVLRADERAADVLKITSQDKSDRDDHVPIPTRSWDPDADHDSFVNLTEPVRVPLADFANHAGTCDPTLWRQIRRLPH
ncbi:type II toxin-antitoxin system PemK/MazF family toxin [Micromonospora thermarum]|uniref:Type II toxin-antitoxin system PemK/MazF family toxin n=1 Tax=Micromonospora thermarum TaxID=2720024 RepID=A0ABX0Z7J6_9ACTN|nr:type II toxin-antitoxin system PemK/MazF family toxin [Micromonospora thermarum]NJP33797.1 type II toxin-antitoxin system PemK/MazF family toxin [Micromonospora thermarum]